MDNQEIQPWPVGQKMVAIRPAVPNTVGEDAGFAIGVVFEIWGADLFKAHGEVCQATTLIDPLNKGNHVAFPVNWMAPLEDPDEDSLYTEGELHTPWAAKGIRERVEELSKELNNHV